MTALANGRRQVGRPTSRVAVVGGGLAGIAAALRCADAGCQVTIFEARRQLGGLTYSFRRGRLHIDNGQHVFLRCCTAYRSLLRRLGVADLVVLQPRLDIRVLAPHRTRPSRLRRSALPAPLHLGGALLRYGLLSPMERIRFIRAALALRRVDIADSATDEQSFGDWLRTHGQTAGVIDAMWDLVGRPTLNLRVTDASLAAAAMVVQVGLLNDRSAADIGWSGVPLGQLHGDAALACLAEAGATVLTGARVDAIEAGAGRWVVRAQADEHVVDQVIAAVPPATAERLLPRGSLQLPDGWASGLGSSPIVNVHVVYDRRVLGTAFAAGVGTPVQWVFDRTAASGLDDGQYLAISLSAAEEFIELPAAALRRVMLPAVGELLPAARQAAVRDFFVTREHHATFRATPGAGRLRPGPVSAAPGLFMAGAWTATGWPATMEGAVRSGAAAAAALLGERERAEVSA